jgi:methionyl-tRNA synthetase
MSKFYLTTPIYYVNARPHIGHAYTTIVADVLARRHRLLGDDVFFLTGTDEHGQKIERSASAAGVPPQAFADQVSASFENLWERMGITNDKFIRTTDPEHMRGVQKLFSLLQERGYIYLSTYTGSYCVSDEAFVDLPAGTPCPDCGRLLETVTEENYFFKLSEFQRPIIDLIESGTLAIQPESRKNEVLSFLRGSVGSVTPLNPVILSEGSRGSIASSAVEGPAVAFSNAGTPYVPGALKDLSISRSSFTWGIPVPGHEKHVIYVWLDALANYMTALGYGSQDESKFERYWPADLHLVGKEIIRFHCVYWPAFLLAAGLELPKAVVAHGWLLFDDSKMSKSKGNIVRTETILDAFGSLKPDASKAEQDLFAADVLRYFLLREIPFGQDGSFSFEAFVTRYNADLANGYGNLVSRTLSMIAKRDGVVPEDKVAAFDPNFVSTDVLPYSVIKMTAEEVGIDLENHAFSAALTKIASLITLVDGYMTQYAPWKLVGSPDKLDQYKAGFILYSAAESIRIITALLYPILPYATASVWRQLGLGDIELASENGELRTLTWGGLQPGTKLGPLAPIFPRADKGLIQQMTDVEFQNAPKSVNEPTPGDGPAPESVASPSTAPSPESVSSSLSVSSLSPEAPTPQIAIEDFAKIDLRVAQIVVAERIPKADKLLRLEVDLGYERRQILSGIAEHYTPEELVGRRIVIIANLAPRKMRGLESHGMLLAASDGDHGKPALATCGDEIPLGSRLK